MVADLKAERDDMNDRMIGQVNDLKRVTRDTWAEAAMKGYTNYLNESTRSR